MANHQQTSAGTEWKLHWALVIASAVGFSFHAVMSYAMGLFMAPLQAEFGWGMAQITIGFTISALLTVPLAPFVGAMIDRWGVRKLALPGLTLKIVSISIFAFADGSVIQWYALWVFYALVAMGIKSTVWTAVISGAFTAGRGLALAVTLSGTALTQVIAPPLSQWLIDSFGWRQAFVWLGVGWGLPALIVCYFFLHDAQGLKTANQKQGRATAYALPGLTIRDAMRNWPLIRVGIATLITMVLGVGAIVHLVPILTEAGFTREKAAYLASLAGIAGIVGKLFTGYLMDRIHAGVVGVCTMLLFALGFVFLLEPITNPQLAIVSTVLFGYAAGCKLQISAYLTGRYGGMRNFGKIFGTMASMIALGSGLGPVLAGVLYDIAGDYSLLMMVGIPGALVCGLLLWGLGPYPDWEAQNAGTPVPA